MLSNGFLLHDRATIFRETTTIGVRYREMTRECLERRTVTVSTSVGDVRIKVAARHGQILNAAPEFDLVLRIVAADRLLPEKVTSFQPKPHIGVLIRSLRDG